MIDPLTALRILGIFKRLWPLWLGLALSSALALYGHHREQTGRAEGRAEIIAKWERANKEAEAKQAKSATQAAVERITDTRTIYVKQKARTNAIQATDDGKPSAASLAVNCLRLSEAGTNVSQFPACRGREAGAEANPKP